MWAGVSNAALARLLQRQPAAARAEPRAAPSPSAGVAAATARLLRGRSSSDADFRRRAEAWGTAAIAAIRAGAAAAGASHADAIVENEAAEIQSAVAALVHDLRGYRDRDRLAVFDESLREFATRKARELEIEFGANVVVESEGYADPGWTMQDLERLDAALGDLPAGAARESGRVVRFRRRMAASGALSTGGETDPATGTITLYDVGMEEAPFGRSRALELPAYMQTIRHELGHLFEHALTPEATHELFDEILGWREYSWAWVTTERSPYERWRAERERLRMEVGMDSHGLTTWLAEPEFTLRGAYRRSETRSRGGRIYVRSAHNGDRLNSLLASEAPRGAEFEYALTNKGDYLAELYAFATSRPAWLAGRISERQKGWWRERAFGLPRRDDEIARLIAVSPEIEQRVGARLGNVFTWEQLSALLTQERLGPHVA
jgi:hypothetical protein